jgi:uncharacterized protein YkwD
MFLALIAAMALLLAAADPPSPPAAPPTTNSPFQQRSPYDADGVQAERQLLEMANRDRARAGLRPLAEEDGLVRAARAHAAEMAAQKQLSHQFSGEPSLIQRIAANSSLHLERVGENVAIAPTVEQAHEALMSSAPHRDNLLNPKFNVAGFGVYRSGGVLYVAQDFGASMATYSDERAEQLVAGAIDELRAQAGMPRLERVNDRAAQSSACRMARADSLGAAPPSAGAYLVRYTSMQPESVPASVARVIARGSLHTYSAGACYAQTQGYPNGAYWVVLVFY